MARLRLVRRVVVFVVGGSMTLVGAVMLPLPPPAAFGIIILPAGLMILSTEFEFARRWLDFIKKKTGPFGRAMQAVEDRAQTLARRVMPARRDAADAPAEPPDG